jgi:hypothetical protein
MTWKFWQRSERRESFDEDMLFRLVSIDKRLGRIEKDLSKALQDLAILKDDSSETRAAVVEINGTVNGHLHSHEQDSGRSNGEAKREHLRRVPTLSEEQ